MLASLGFIIVYVGACWLLGFLGRYGKFSFWGNFWISIILTPLIGTIIVLAQENTKKRIGPITPS